MTIYVKLGNTQQERFHNYLLLSEWARKDGGGTYLIIQSQNFVKDYYFVAQWDMWTGRLYYTLVISDELNRNHASEIPMSNFELFDMSGLFDWYGR